MSIEIRDFTFTYYGRKRPALTNINIKVEAGSIVGVLGPAGSGKSTLVMALNGLVPKAFPGKTIGDVIVNGLNTRDHELTELSAHVGIVLANPAHQLFALSVEDDVAFGPANMGLPANEIRDRVRIAMQATRLEGFQNRNPNELSGGEQQSLAIAGVLAMRPKIMALDEPVAMLDPVGKQRVLSVITEINKSYGNTTIVTEAGSNIEVLVGVLDRLIVFQEGRIVADGRPSDILARTELEIARPVVTDLFLRMQKKDPKLKVPISVEEAAEYIGNVMMERNKRIHRPTPHEEERSAPRGNPIVKVRNLYHTYPGKIQALRGVSFDIDAGSMVGILGQNGSGKTTLSYHLVGLLKPTKKDAQVIVDGADVTRSSINEVTKHINYVFQNPENQLFCETVREEIAFGLKMRGLSLEAINERVRETLALFGAEDHIEDPIIFTSLDLKTYVAIASILALTPKVLIVDEPATALDRTRIARVMSVLKDLNKSGWTILVITHQIDDVAIFCDHLIVMKEGAILTQGTTKEVFSKPELLREAFLNPPQITQLAQRLRKFEFPTDIMTTDAMEDFLWKNVFG